MKDAARIQFRREMGFDAVISLPVTSGAFWLSMKGAY